MDDLTKFLFSGTPFTEQEIETASVNYDNQVDMVGQLHTAFVASGYTYEYVAEQLGATVDEVKAYLFAEYDMTLTELRYIANVLNVSINYQIVPVIT